MLKVFSRVPTPSPRAALRGIAAMWDHWFFNTKCLNDISPSIHIQTKDGLILGTTASALRGVVVNRSWGYEISLLLPMEH